MFQTGDGRFPYRILIRLERDKYYDFRVQNRWPGPGKSVFCMNDGILESKEMPKDQAPVEKCSILSAQWYGSRLPLASGDYALKLEDGELISAVERKTRDNFLHEMGRPDALKAVLQELCEVHKYKALVIESTYADLIDPKKLKFYRGGTVANFIADLTASFPELQITFCKNSKFANEWVIRYFQAIKEMEEPNLG